MTRIHATIEFIPSQRAAVVESHDTAGNWLGGSRIESPLKSYRIAPGSPSKEDQDRAALYEIGYTVASVNAKAHGGQLDRYGWV